MSNFEKLRRLLEELFQLDQADLDFGIYRIMNQKRDEIVTFLDKDLLPQVKESFSHYKSADKATLQKELDKLVENVTSAGMNPDESPKVQDLRTQIADSAVDVTALEHEVFSHLYTFFRRYYHEGDFISQRRYKEGVYAIPYEGEEVKLYWANHDQYYVKSSEYLRDFRFQCSVFSVQEDGSQAKEQRRVSFKLVSGSTEQDNKKEQAGKERRFMLCEDDPVIEENGELVIRFEYKPHEDKAKQDALNQQAVETVLSLLNTENCQLKTESLKTAATWHDALAQFAPTAKNKERTLLAKHLAAYTARNTFDYFIHKDLGGFLRRELDFYIKNEVMHLDDIEHDTVPRVEQYLSKIKVIRKIAHKIIQFLAQLENFQKKLWLKKKFVVETNYCITLDQVPEELYEEITANDAQREEWVRLFAIDEIEKDLNGPGYSVPLTTGFFKAHRSLPLDTANFPRSLVDRLVSSFQDLADETDAIVVRGENFNALSLLTPRYRQSIKCVYNDPPYNTGRDGFSYKDTYQHSSWLAMFQDRLALASNLLADDGTILTSINDIEQPILRLAMANEFGDDNLIANMVWKGATDNNPTRVAVEHEYILIFAKSKSDLDAHWSTTESESKQLLLDAYNELKAKASSFEKLEEAFSGFAKTNREALGDLYRYRRLDQNGPYAARRNMDNPGKPGHRYDVIHPKTGKPCAMPTWGWRFTEMTMRELLANDRIIFGENEEKIPELKVYLKDVKFPLRSVINMDSRKGSNNLDRLFGARDVFKNPKPAELITQLLQFVASDNSTVCDFFAGSGTTGDAVIALNREDGGRRKAVLIEVDEVFENVMLPRLKKCTYSPEWKDGKPVRSASPEEIERGPRITKYIRLESYDDALNNLEMKRTDQQGSLLAEDDDLREQYILSYMLDVESRGSQSLLNVESFRNPDEYKLKVERNGETQLVNVDLVETFNWLLGLTVKHIDVIPLKKGQTGVRVVEGTNPDGERVLVLWRNLDEIDNDALDKWFAKQDYNTKEQVYDLFYVNGDNNLENLRRPDQTWKVRLIEEEFQRLMFDVEDV